jgi:quercetin dioxygenase-like cupin family protein
MNCLINRGLVFISLIHLILLSCSNKKELPDPLMAGWKGSKVCELIVDNENVRVLRCTFAPGVGHERHYHDPHFGVTLSGSTFRITDETGTREVDVSSNSNFYSDGKDWHEVLNVGDSTAVFLIIEPK